MKRGKNDFVEKLLLLEHHNWALKRGFILHKPNLFRVRFLDVYETN